MRLSQLFRQGFVGKDSMNEASGRIDPNLEEPAESLVGNGLRRRLAKDN